jgi:aspartate aminotransferase-like enzyme
MKAVADAVHSVDGLFVLDCIASGCIWVDMLATGVDVLISAPQKGWSGSPSVGIVVLSKAARERLDSTKSTAFALDLKKWVSVMEAYESGGHMYHTTMPTDSIIGLRDVMLETKALGFGRVRQQQFELGAAVRSLLASKGYKSVAAPGFAAPGVVVSYTADPEVKTGAKFAAIGLQIAAGVPLMLDEFTTSSPAFSTFRLGLFGIDKLNSIKDATSKLQRALDAVAVDGSLATAARL